MPATKSATLLSAATTQAAPSAATDGVLIRPGTDRADLLLRSTAGSGTMSALIRVWLMNADEEWYPASIGSGAAAASTAGVLNGGNAIEEIAANDLHHYEVAENLANFERMAAEIITLGGTATAVTLEANWHRAEFR